MQHHLRQFKADIFQALGHPTRIAIMESLRDNEKSTGSLIELLGLDQSNASQHLTVLRAKQIVISRKEGNQVFYSVRDRIIVDLLDLMRCYFENHVQGTLAMLEQVQHEESLEKI